MGTFLRLEEYAPLADFIKVSFERDQEKLVERFPKLNADFLTAFNEKLAAVKVLDSRLVLTESQRKTTESLYKEAAELSSELTFVNSYLADAALSTTAITALKNDLSRRNIEGALLKIESVKQYLTANLDALTEEGLAPDFPAQLDAHKTSLSEKNGLQNSLENTKISLTNANRLEYVALYEMISKIAKAGKLVFDKTPVQQEYSVSHVVSRMRAPNANA